MDDRQFDSFVKSLARARTRRSVLAGLLGLGGAALTGATRQPSVTAARRTTPTPKPVTCPGQQAWSGSACVCPAPLSGCGPDCCNDVAPAGTQAHSECCDNACCAGHCYGEELCCPWPREFCEITSDCCLEGAVCCADSGCCNPDAGRCCDVLGVSVCRTFDLCCDDSECTEYANSSCDVASGQCICTPNACTGQLGGVCGADVDDGCGGVISDCDCADSPLVTCVWGENICAFDCAYWQAISGAGNIVEIAIHICETVGLCDDDAAATIEALADACR
ncbi:MAG: hypothetical protein M9947_15575 [Thermomicrobiales bacterium]|nr:hypothetical protein [Thermomicrobiales bacterium]